MAHMVTIVCEMFVPLILVMRLYVCKLVNMKRYVLCMINDGVSEFNYLLLEMRKIDEK